jgi:hypothetical protein
MNNIQIMQALLALVWFETLYTRSEVMEVVKSNGLDFDKVTQLRNEMAGEL